jgi:hypothetical protein
MQHLSDRMEAGRGPEGEYEHTIYIGNPPHAEPENG